MSGGDAMRVRRIALLVLSFVCPPLAVSVSESAACLTGHEHARLLVRSSSEGAMCQLGAYPCASWMQQACVCLLEHFQEKGLGVSLMLAFSSRGGPVPPA
jgi:hypothetical protein